MSKQRTSQQPAGESRARERCVCNEVFDHLQDAFGISPEVRKHLANSRIELLKAVRRAIDDRIERLSNAAAHGTKINVE